MKNYVYTVCVEKKPNFNNEARGLGREFAQLLSIDGIEKVRVINKYDICGVDEKWQETIIKTVLCEVNVDNVHEGSIDLGTCKYFVVEYLPGQYDQRADSAAQCIQLIIQEEMPKVKTSKIIAIYGNLKEEELEKIKAYYINSVDSREASLNQNYSFQQEATNCEEVAIIEGFIDFDEKALEAFLRDGSLAMSLQDIMLVQSYFKEKEKRNPSITEVKVIDTYWSDHCRHTTFLTALDNIDFEKGRFNMPALKAFSLYKDYRRELYKDKVKDMSLMDIAVIAMKKLKQEGKLKNLDVSEEINACSIIVDADIDGKTEKYVVMFKNETHNHPTEIEPFGGASTCIGGAIRDPLSGRSYVYQAMRITGSGDPRTPVEKTLKGKLPQRKITKEAARGYSSYGNQIGLATGYVKEIYHQGYVAKRMEIGAVIGAAPYENIHRSTPEPGDVVILLGGRTGRDGIGGASGSSKEHNEASINSCSAEVQKGNAPTERKLQRLFRSKKAARLIKRCNDFGAGGVCVAIGELADGICINLDLVPKKYEGLDGTELAISESQERMAVVVSKEYSDEFIKLAMEENLEAAVVAEVTEEKRVVMSWRGNTIVNLSREFLNTNGAKAHAEVFVEAPKDNESNLIEGLFTKSFKEKFQEGEKVSLKEKLKEILSDINICSQRGLVEMFDSSIGGGTVLMPYGGKYQGTASEGMVSKLPVREGITTTGTIMTYGFNPYLSEWSCFHGALYAVVESITKLVIMGGSLKDSYLTFQEYFEKLGRNPAKWGKPFSSLLGALYAQHNLGIAAIGGKDSMSGSFKELTVPPTLVSFAVSPINIKKAVSQEFKRADSIVVLLKSKLDHELVMDFEELKANYEAISKLIQKDMVLSSHSITSGGIMEAVCKMTFGNQIGFCAGENVDLRELEKVTYGSAVLELKRECFQEALEILKGASYQTLGVTTEEKLVRINDEELPIAELSEAYEIPLQEVFPVDYEVKPFEMGTAQEVAWDNASETYKSYGLKSELWSEERKVYISMKNAKPRVIIPVFPGTNCEYDCERAFKKAGAEVNQLIFKNLSSKHIEESILALEKAIKESQIIMLPGGFSAGDEPDGSGKFINAIFRNSRIKEAVLEHLRSRDGMILGICNGFQALIKLGLVTYGEIRDLEEHSPTLLHNALGRHVSCMVNTKIINNDSPWLQGVEVGDVHTIPISHGEGRFFAEPEALRALIENKQIVTQYVDFEGKTAYDAKFNPNGSTFAIEGITSPDGRVFGKMGHSERFGENLFKNVKGSFDQRIFESGVKYYK